MTKQKAELIDEKHKKLRANFRKGAKKDINQLELDLMDLFGDPGKSK